MVSAASSSAHRMMALPATAAPSLNGQAPGVTEATIEAATLGLPILVMRVSLLAAMRLAHGKSDWRPDDLRCALDHEPAAVRLKRPAGLGQPTHDRVRPVGLGQPNSLSGAGNGGLDGVAT